MTKDAWPVRFATTSDGLEIAYMTQAGEGPPFLVVTPLPCPGRMSSGRIPGVEQFCARFLRANACYEFEWRGIGLSGKPKDVVTFDDLVLDIAAVAEAIGEPINLMAIGAACVPTVAFASRHPQVVQSLLLDTPSLRLVTFAGRPESPEHYDDILTSWLRNSFDFPPDVVARELLPLFRQDNPFGVVTEWSAAVEAARLNAAGRAAACPAPTLVYTNPESAGDANAFAESLPGVQTVIDRSFAYNGVRADAMRIAFDQFLRGTACLPERPAAQHRSNGLTERELEVLRLLATGKTNREISTELVVSVNTVERHVTHIYSKIGASNRVEAADWARRSNLY